ALNPHGACPTCDGLGPLLYFDPELVVPDPSKSLADGAIAPWSRTMAPYYVQALEGLARKYGFSMTRPWSALPEKAREIILYGSGGDDVDIVYKDERRTYTTSKPFEGVIPNIERRWRETDSAWAREELSRFQSAAPCESCNGRRLKPEALAVKIAGLNIAEVSDMSVGEALTWF